MLADVVGLGKTVIATMIAKQFCIDNGYENSYRVIFVPKTVNHKGQADKVIEFIPSTSPLAEGINKEYVVIKEREKKKLLPGTIVKLLKDKGYSKLNMHHS